MMTSVLIVVGIVLILFGATAGFFIGFSVAAKNMPKTIAKLSEPDLDRLADAVAKERDGVR